MLTSVLATLGVTKILDIVPELADRPPINNGVTALLATERTISNKPDYLAKVLPVCVIAPPVFSCCLMSIFSVLIS